MSYNMGSKIRKLREERKFSQEEMAKVLNTTRQRYARLENGQVDLSYVLIKKIAVYLGVNPSEITSVEQFDKELVTFFRDENFAQDIKENVSKIENILRVFNAHEKLYYQMKACDENEDR